LAVVKLTTVEVTKLPLEHKINKTRDLLCKVCTDTGLAYSAQGRIFNNMVYCRNVRLTKGQTLSIRDKPNFSSKRMLRKDYYCKGSVERKMSLVLGLKGLDAKTN
jgi:hypothetical protein